MARIARPGARYEASGSAPKFAGFNKDLAKQGVPDGSFGPDVDRVEENLA